MNLPIFRMLILVSLTWSVLLSGCAKKSEPPATATAAHQHEHVPPHGGTPVVLGHELYHLEFVLDAPNGKLQAYVFDGEMENFVRLSARNFTVQAVVEGTPQSLLFQAVANPATGETVGDTALFEATADWLKSTPEFNGAVQSITIRGTTFNDVKFNFPRGNDRE